MNGKNEPVDGSKLPPAFISQFDYYSQTKQKGTIMNPEKLFEEATAAIDHRCVSTTNHWYIIYYHDRLCCVPTNENVPPKIILGKFTEQMAQARLTLDWWNELETSFTKLYEELHK